MTVHIQNQIIDCYDLLDVNKTQIIVLQLNCIIMSNLPLQGKVTSLFKYVIIQIIQPWILDIVRTFDSQPVITECVLAQIYNQFVIICLFDVNIC